MLKFRTSSTTDSAEPQVTRRVTTENVETSAGYQTKTTTITCTEKNFDAAFERLNLDPQKFYAGGTSVTKQIIYTNSAGQKEVIEETVETFNKPPKESSRKSSESRTLAQKLGFGKSSPKTSTSDNLKTQETKAKTVVLIKPGQFEKECLDAHNEYRAKHGVPKLSLCKEMCAYSKEWANHLSATEKFEHRTDRKYGENIYMKWSSDPNHTVTGKEAVDSWYSEIKDFTFGQEPRTLKSGHFTQVIWKASQKLGVAWARSKSGKILVVANYDPPGNFVGTFSANVPSLKK